MPRHHSLPLPALQPLPHEHDAIALQARVRHAIETAPPGRRAAMEAGLLRFAIHPRQRLGEWHYLELCAGYVHTMVDSAYETARGGWLRLHEAVGWVQVLPKRVRLLGGVLRRLTWGQRHGQHLLIPQWASAALREVAAELGVLRETKDEHLSWRAVVPVRRGSSLMCRCPFHGDRNPSMILDPARGCATCFACGTSHRLDAEKWVVSGPRERAAPSASGTTSTIACPRGPMIVPDGVVATVTRGRRYVVRVVSEGLLEVLKAAEGVAKGQKPPKMASASARPHWLAPELTVFVDRMRRGPQKWDPVSTRWIAVDVDTIWDVPMDRATASQGLLEAGAGVEAWARGQALLSGRIALTRTSYHGVQVLLELAAPVRVEWRETSEALLLHEKVEAFVLGALEDQGFRGGHADPTARGKGRLVRLPGPRAAKYGMGWVARLVYASQ